MTTPARNCLGLFVVLLTRHTCRRGNSTYPSPRSDRGASEIMLVPVGNTRQPFETHLIRHKEGRSHSVLIPLDSFHRRIERKVMPPGIFRLRRGAQRQCVADVISGRLL